MKTPLFFIAKPEKTTALLLYRYTVYFEIYAVHTPTNALFINLVKSFKFTLKYTIISLLHVSVFNPYPANMENMVSS